MRNIYIGPGIIKTMAGLQFKRIPRENEKCVRDFLRDAKDFGPEDVDKFLSGVDDYAARKGKVANFAISYSNSALTMDLWLEPQNGVDATIRRVFRFQREGKAFPRNGGHYLVGSGAYYLSREMSDYIPHFAIKVTPAIMNSRIDAVSDLLKYLRKLLSCHDQERAREAKWDLEQACKGGRVGFVEFYNGNRLDIF